MKKEEYIAFSHLSFETKMERINSGEVDRGELRKSAREYNVKAAKKRARHNIESIHRRANLVERTEEDRSSNQLKFADRDRVVKIKYKDQEIPTPTVRLRKVKARTF